MTRQEFKSGARFKVVDNDSRLFKRWEYFFRHGSILAVDHCSNTSLHAFVMGTDSKYVYVRFYLLGKEVKKRIPLNNLQII